MLLLIEILIILLFYHSVFLHLCIFYVLLSVDVEYIYLSQYYRVGNDDVNRVIDPTQFRIDSRKVLRQQFLLSIHEPTSLVRAVRESIQESAPTHKATLYLCELETYVVQFEGGLIYPPCPAVGTGFLKN